MEDREHDSDAILTQCLQAIRELAEPSRYSIREDQLNAVLKYATKAFEIAKAKCRTEAEAMELVTRCAESVFKAIKNKKTNKEEEIEDVCAYSWTVFGNESSRGDASEPHGSVKISPLTDQVLQLTPGKSQAPDQAIIAEERSAQLEQAIGLLKLELREVVVAFMVFSSHRDTYKQAASSLGIKINTFKTRLHRARQKLRDLLGDDFFE